MKYALTLWQDVMVYVYLYIYLFQTSHEIKFTFNNFKQIPKEMLKNVFYVIFKYIICYTI